MPSRNMSKILLKILDNGTPKWVHFAYVSKDLYKEFFDVTKCEKSAFCDYLSIWVKGDFGMSLKMVTYTDIRKLKSLVKRKYRLEYSELYSLTDQENPSIYGWLRIWLSQHMRVEIAARKDYTE